MSPESLLQHRDFVRALARRLVGDGDRADDVVQQTWLAALRRPPERQGVRAWLAAVVRNAALRQKRDERRRRSHERLAPTRGPVPTPEDVFERERARQRVVEAVLALEPTYRDVILLRYFEDLTPSEIAARTGTPVETVKTRLKRATKRLRAALDREFGTRSAWVGAISPLAGARLDLAAAVPRHASTAGVLAIGAKAKLTAVTLICAGVLLPIAMTTGNPSDDGPEHVESGPRIQQVAISPTPAAPSSAAPTVAQAPKGPTDSPAAYAIGQHVDPLDQEWSTFERGGRDLGRFFKSAPRALGIEWLARHSRLNPSDAYIPKRGREHLEMLIALHQERLTECEHGRAAEQSRTMDGLAARGALRRIRFEELSAEHQDLIRERARMMFEMFETHPAMTSDYTMARAIKDAMLHEVHRFCPEARAFRAHEGETYIATEQQLLHLQPFWDRAAELRRRFFYEVIAWFVANGLTTLDAMGTDIEQFESLNRRR